MAKSTDKRRLGRGLSALMADIEPNAAQDAGPSDARASGRTDRQIPIEDVQPNPDQPRRAFDEEQLRELAASIREHGIIQPLIVRPDPAESGKYQIVAGERRWRAAQIAQLHEVPALVRDFDDNEVLQVAIIENVQRADLNPIEEALGYKQLMEKFGHTQLALSTAMGKSRSHLANMMRLLQLPDEIQAMVRDGELSSGHARALVTAENPIALALRAVREGMSVRDIEKAAKAGASGSTVGGATTRPEKDADTRALEADLKAALSMKVSIDHNAQSGAGKITINYKDLEQLDDLMRKLNAG
ncbi:ParB/RepB/Spo0J family partition protein [Gymnodinialimonas hymeniacidonis]|uniref:ParB/RepB/Spo0J family partition protein n=1 Tax=Gymnodinialimonas hymeniacidonis TaxID=3126508 RepID=UPI0034C5C668